MIDLQTATQEACDRIGIVFRQVPTDSNWHVTDAVNKRPKNGNGRIKLFPDGTGGMVQDWGTMDTPEVFFADSGVKLSPSEIAERNRRRRSELENAERERAKERAEASELSLVVWKKSHFCLENAYLQPKQVKPTDTLREIRLEDLIKIIGYHPSSKGKPFSGEMVLIAPVRNANGLATIEMIDECGLKAGLKGGQKSGGFWATERLPDSDGLGLIIGIGEGVATMLTYRKNSGCIGIAALSSGNLMAVARYFRVRYPNASIYIISDVGNGEKHAFEAAETISGILAKPIMPEGSTGSDINDLMIEVGPDAVKACLADAVLIDSKS